MQRIYLTESWGVPWLKRSWNDLLSRSLKGVRLLSCILLNPPSKDWVLPEDLSTLRLLLIPKFPLFHSVSPIRVGVFDLFAKILPKHALSFLDYFKALSSIIALWYSSSWSLISFIDSWRRCCVGVIFLSSILSCAWLFLRFKAKIGLYAMFPCWENLGLLAALVKVPSFSLFDRALGDFTYGGELSLGKPVGVVGMLGLTTLVRMGVEAPTMLCRELMRWLPLIWVGEWWILMVRGLFKSIVTNIYLMWEKDAADFLFFVLNSPSSQSHTDNKSVIALSAI